MMAAKSLFILEDDILLRDLLGDLVTQEKQFNLVGTADDGVDGLRQCLALAPDIVVCDIRLPGLNGLEVVERLRRDLPEVVIVMVSGSFNLGRIRQAMVLRAQALISKGAGLPELVKALRAVAQGRTYYSADVVARMPELLAPNAPDQTLSCLTPREREVLQLVGEGYTNKEVAVKLGISDRTADVHRTHVMQKLKVRNVAGLTRYAIGFGLVDAETELSA